LEDRQHCTPLLLTDRNSKGQQLYQVPVGKPPFNEARLQELLALHPELLPVSEIEPAFSPLFFLGREVPCNAGSIDLFFTNPSGYMTIVETKLWSNPESRRQAVAQVVDYATSLSNWNFDDLDNALKKAVGEDNKKATNSIERLFEDEELFDQPSYIDSVSRNLSRGNFLLIIVGNGIREDLERIADYMQKTPGLHYTLALVEMNIYSLQEGSNYPLYIQPRTIAKTVELVRAVVDIKAPPNISVQVEVPSEEEIKKGKTRRKLTEQIFYDELANNSNEELKEQLKDLMQSLYDLGLVSVWRSSSVSMRLPDPGGSGYKFTVIVFTVSGSAYTGWTSRISWPEYGGYDKEIANDYHKCLEALFNDKYEEYTPGDPVPVHILIENKKDFLNCVKGFITPIIKAAEGKTEEP